MYFFSRFKYQFSERVKSDFFCDVIIGFHSCTEIIKTCTLFFSLCVPCMKTLLNIYARLVFIITMIILCYEDKLEKRNVYISIILKLSICHARYFTEII